MGHHRFVDVDTAEVFDACRGAPPTLARWCLSAGGWRRRTCRRRGRTPRWSRRARRAVATRSTTRPPRARSTSRGRSTPCNRTVSTSRSSFVRNQGWPDASALRVGASPIRSVVMAMTRRNRSACSKLPRSERCRPTNGGVGSPMRQHRSQTTRSGCRRAVASTPTGDVAVVPERGGADGPWQRRRRSPDEAIGHISKSRLVTAPPCATMPVDAQPVRHPQTSQRQPDQVAGVSCSPTGSSPSPKRDLRWPASRRRREATATRPPASRCRGYRGARPPPSRSRGAASSTPSRGRASAGPAGNRPPFGRSSRSNLETAAAIVPLRETIERGGRMTWTGTV